MIFSNAPYDVANPAFQALMVFAGGVLQMVLLVLVVSITYAFSVAMNHLSRRGQWEMV